MSMSLCSSNSSLVSCGGVGAGSGAAGSTFAAALQLLISSQCLLTEPWPPHTSLPNGSVVDVIIVGGGTGGSALAARLAETNLTVLLLEAGPDPPIESIVPGLKEYLLRGVYDWNYTAVDDHYSSQELANRHQRMRAGRVLGGTGSLNSMVYSRSFPADYDEWARIANDSTWSWTNVLPYFLKTEKLTDIKVITHRPSRQYHAYKGEIEVTALEKENFDSTKFLEAFCELGIKAIVDRNNPETLGAYHQSFTVKNGKRQSTLTAMLNKVSHRSNLFVMKNALVTKILINQQKVYGVSVLNADEQFNFYAKKEVVLSAGVYNTPKLLMLSGIGPKWHLESLGIKVESDLPVGSNLQDHINSRIFLAAESGTCPKTDLKFEAIKYLYNRTGSLAIPDGVGVDFVLKNSSTPNVPDFGIYPTCFVKGHNFFDYCLRSTDFTRELCLHLHSINRNHDLFVFSVILRRPISRGSIRLASTDPLEKPIIYMGTFANEADLVGFPEVYETVWSLVNTSYFRSKNAFVVDLKLKSCEGFVGPELVKCLARGLAMSESHGVGTAPMGAVVDGRLRVRGVRGLRVVDASAVPLVPRCNTNAPVVMLAEKAAQLIQDEYLPMSFNGFRMFP